MVLPWPESGAVGDIYEGGRVAEGIAEYVGVAACVALAAIGGGLWLLTRLVRPTPASRVTTLPPARRQGLWLPWVLLAGAILSLTLWTRLPMMGVVFLALLGGCLGGAVALVTAAVNRVRRVPEGSARRPLVLAGAGGAIVVAGLAALLGLARSFGSGGLLFAVCLGSLLAQAFVVITPFLREGKR